MLIALRWRAEMKRKLVVLSEPRRERADRFRSFCQSRNPSPLANLKVAIWKSARHDWIAEKVPARYRAFVMPSEIDDDGRGWRRFGIEDEPHERKCTGSLQGTLRSQPKIAHSFGLSSAQTRCHTRVCLLTKSLDDGSAGYC